MVHIIPFSALFISTFLLLMGNGLGNILIPLRASAEGWSAVVIGGIGASYALCFTFGCVLTPYLVRRVGHVRVHAALLACLAVSVLLITLSDEPLLWFLARGLTGLSLSGTYMVIESWLNDGATNENRGLIFSTYMVVSMAGLTAGQFILPFGNIMTTTLFVVCALLYLAALIPTSMTLAQSPRPLTQVTINFRKLYKNSVVSVVASFLSGLILGAWMLFAPIFGQKIGLSSLQISLMLALATVGGVLLQFPLGHWSDRVDRRSVIRAVSIAASILCASVSFFETLSPKVIFIVALFLGGGMFPLYALVVAHANDHADEGDFVSVSSGLLVIYGAGTVVGPQLAGAMIAMFGAQGFFFTLTLGFSLVALHTTWRMMRSEPATIEDKIDFPIQPINKAPTPQTYALDPRSDVDFEQDTP